MKISIARQNINPEKVEVDVIHTTEIKERITPEKLKAKRSYLVSNIEKWQTELAKVDELLEKIYEQIQISKN